MGRSVKKISVGGSNSSHLGSIDLLRGFAALSILIWHYQHFYYYSGQVQGDLLVSSPPYEIFEFIRFINFEGVQVFWVISGVVLGRSYIPRLRSRKSFLVNRLARLYPLHLLTLIIVASLQLIANLELSKSLIYSNNSIRHFFWNLILISGWGPSPGFSFNGPIWSVSVEIVIYFFFITVVGFLRASTIFSAFLFLFCFAGLYLFVQPHFIFSCGFFFFFGILINHIFSRKSLSLNLAGIMILVLLEFRFSLNGISFLPVIYTWLVLNCERLSFVKRKSITKISEFFGKISYGIYLIHVPVQIFLLLIALVLKINIKELADNFIFFCLYISIVVVLAIISYKFFEEPFRKKILRIKSLNI